MGMMYDSKALLITFLATMDADFSTDVRIPKISSLILSTMMLSISNSTVMSLIQSEKERSVSTQVRLIMESSVP
jgi:hypothetical protein